MSSIDDLRAKISEAKNWRAEDNLKESFWKKVTEKSKGLMGADKVRMESALSEFITEESKEKQGKLLDKMVELKGVSGNDFIELSKARNQLNADLEKAAQEVLNLKLDEQELVKPQVVKPVVVEKEPEERRSESPVGVNEELSDDEGGKKEPEVTPEEVTQEKPPKENVILGKMGLMESLVNNGDIVSEEAIGAVEGCMVDRYHLNLEELNAFMTTWVEMSAGVEDTSIPEENKEFWRAKILTGDKKLERVFTTAFDRVVTKDILNEKVRKIKNAIAASKDSMRSGKNLKKSGYPQGEQMIEKAVKDLKEQADIIKKLRAFSGLADESKEALNKEIKSARIEYKNIRRDDQKSLAADNIKCLCANLLEAHNKKDGIDEIEDKKDDLGVMIDKLSRDADKHEMPRHKQALDILKQAIGETGQTTKEIRGKLIQEANDHIKDADPDADPKSPSTSS